MRVQEVNKKMSELEPVCHLAVDIEELEDAFETNLPDARHYLDLETGQVVMVTDETQGILHDLAVEQSDQTTNASQPFAHALDASELPDWQKEVVREAFQVEHGLCERYIEIPSLRSDEAYQDMQEFVAAIENSRIQARLEVAIEGRGVFRRFRDELAQHPRERERWFDYKRERMRARVMDWLENEGIETIAKE
jgi:hypothetical protein